jgi:hypothetical protein
MSMILLEPTYKISQSEIKRRTISVKPGRSQPVDATPSDMNSFSRGVVYGTRKTEQAFD